MWRGFVGSCWLGPGCPVLRAGTRENPVGKNGVMTPPSFEQAFARAPRLLERRIDRNRGFLGSLVGFVGSF